jgi:hypothetical protein
LNQVNVSKKKWTRWIFIFALVLLMAGLGFLVMGGPEWIAASIIRGQLRQIGMGDVEIKGLKLSFSGDFQLSSLDASGRIEAATDVMNSLSLEILEIQGRVNWSDLWAGSSSQPDREQQSPVAYFPVFISRISFQDATIHLELQDGRRLLAEGSKADMEHPDPESLAIETVLKKFSVDDDWGVENAELAMRIEGQSIKLEKGKARLPEGALVFSGKSDDLYAMTREVEAAGDILNSTGENLIKRMVALQSVFHRSGTEISGSFVPESLGVKRQVPWDIDFDGNQEINFFFESASNGLNIKVDSHAIVFSMNENSFFFSKPILEVNSEGVFLSAEPVARRIARTDAPRVPVFLKAEILFNEKETYPFWVSLQNKESIALKPLLNFLQNVTGVPPENVVPIEGEGNMTLEAGGQCQPFQMDSARLNVNLDSTVKVSELIQPLSLEGLLLAELKDQQLSINTENFLMAEAPTDIEVRVELDNWKPVRLDAGYSIQGLNPPEILSPTIPLRATGSINVKGGIQSATPLLDNLTGNMVGEGEFEEIVYAGRQTIPVSAEWSGLWEAGKLQIEKFELQSGQSHLRAAGEIDSTTISGEYDLEVYPDFLEHHRSDWENIPEWFQALNLQEDGRIKVSGKVSGTFQNPESSLQLEANHGIYREIKIPTLQAKVFFEKDRLAIPQFSLTALPLRTPPAAELAGSGWIDLATPLSMNLSLEASPLPLEIGVPWLPDSLLPVEGFVRGTVELDYSDQILDLKADISSNKMQVAGQNIGQTNLEIELNGEQARGSLNMDDLLGGSLQARFLQDAPGRLQLLLSGEDIQLAGTPGMPQQVSGVVNLSATASLARDQLTFQTENVLNALKGSVTMEFQETFYEGLAIEDLRGKAHLVSGSAEAFLSSASPQLEMSLFSSFPFEEVELRAGWEKFPFGHFMPKFENRLAITNSADMELKIKSGILTEGEILSRSTQVRTEEFLLEQQSPARMTLEGKILNIDSLKFFHPEFPRSQLQLSGKVPLGTDEPGLLLDYEISGINLALLDLELPEIRDIAGNLEGQGTISGIISDPTLQGDIRISRGRLRMEGMPQGVSDIEMKISGNEEGLQLEKLTGRMGKGTLSATGEVDISSGTAPVFRTRLDFESVRYPVMEDMDVEMDGSLLLEGDLLSPLITGEVTVTRGGFTRPFDWTGLLLNRFGRVSTAKVDQVVWNPQLDIKVNMPGNFWIRNSIVTAEAAAEGRLVGTLANPAFTGRAYARRGVFIVNFGRFNIERAIALFDEARPFIPSLMVEGAAQVGRYNVRLILSGEPTALELFWSSSPPLREEEIARLLTTGSPRQTDGEAGAASALWLLTQGVRHRAGTEASGRLPVDTLELRPSRQEGEIHPEIVAEKKLTDRLTLLQSVGFKDPGNPAVGAEYQLTDQFSLSGRAKKGNVYILELIYQILY